jgi:3-oxoacyl-[acyl-carrier protein] reductase
MDLGIRGKVAFVGGASKGLGRGCALSLAEEGVKVAICARGAGRLKETAQFIKEKTGSEVLGICADLSRPADIEKAVAKAFREFGRIDILVVNSGGPPAGKFSDLSRKQWLSAFDSVLYYAIALYGLVIPGMKKRSWGRIINIASLTVKEPSEDLVLSNVFRSGLVSLAKTISRELISHNITINTVLPGAFKTDRAIELMGLQAKRKRLSVTEIEKQLVSQLPLKRFQSPRELGDLVAFLASDLASGITGTTIEADGGISRSV